MGNLTREEAEKFCSTVLRLEGHTDWTMMWGCAPSVCMRERKTIIIKEKILKHGYSWEVKQEILHEIAHIDVINECGHGPLFFAEFARLVIEYFVNTPI